MARASVKNWIFVVAGICGFYAAASAVTTAEAADAAATPAVLEEIEVIGSRIKQTSVEVVSPVLEISSSDIKYQGSTSMEQLLNNYPQILADQTPFGGFTGIASVNLRGLGPSRTLVLIDGRRVPPGDPTVPVADIDTIPVGLVDSVEVLTGGASATYGSDALAGVVNFKLKRNFEGMRIDAQYGFVQHHNGSDDAQAALVAAGFPGPNSNIITGRSRLVTAIFGANGADGSSNVTAYMSYREQDGVQYGEYDRSACALAGPAAPHVCNGSSNYDRFIVLNPAPPGTSPATDFFGLPNATLKPYNSATDNYNFSPPNYLERPDNRYQIGAFAHKEINPHLDLYAETMFTQDRTVQQQAPSAIFLGTGLVNGGILVPCNNPFLSADQVQKLCTNFGLASTDQVNLLVGRRDIEGGPRVYDLTHTAQRYVGGVKGEIADGWTYDISAQYSVTAFEQRQLNQLSKSRTLNALDVVVVGGVATCRATVNGTDPNCVPLNILGGLGSWTPAMVNYISTDASETGSTVERIDSANVTGDLGHWGVKSPWATKPVALALGAEHRTEGLEYLPGGVDLAGDIFGGAQLHTQPMSGFRVNEVYGETSIPIVDDAPFAKSLRLEAGIRGSDYSTSGRVSSSKLAFNWAPIEDLHIRASLQHAVRAPNVLELFAPQLTTTFSGVDPCSGAVPIASLATCQHMGVTAAQYGHIVDCPTNLCGAISGGNSALTPESSVTKSFGFIYTPAAVVGLSTSIDIFDIRVKNTISTIGAGVTLNQCVQTLNPFFCDLIHRDSNGSLFAGNSGIVDTNLNTGTLRTQGVDVQAGYALGMGGFGHMAFNLVGTYVKKLETEPLAGLGSYDCAGLFGFTCGVPHPKWRHSMRSTWESAVGLDVSLNWRYFSNVGFDGNVAGNQFLSQGTNIAPIGARSFFDLSGSMHFGEKVTATVGITNILDKDPPVLDSTYTGIAGNTYPQVYDAMGRTIFLGLSVKL